MATKRIKSRRRSCKNGKLKRPVHTKKGGKRRCKKSKKKSRRKRRKSRRKSRRKKFRMSNEDELAEKFGINKLIYTEKLSDNLINTNLSYNPNLQLPFTLSPNRRYYMIKKIYYDYNPYYYDEDTDNKSKQSYLDEGKAWYIDIQEVDFAGNVVNSMMYDKLDVFIKLFEPINKDNSGIVG